MTKQNRICSTYRKEPYVITQAQKDAARERINKQKEVEG